MMNDENLGSMLAIILWIGTIILSIGAGFLAWDWIEPDSFWRTILFIIVWGILIKISYFIIGMIVMLLTNK